MDRAASGLSCAEMVDIAALGILAGEALTEEALLEQIVSALHPQLSPTGEVVYGRLVRCLAKGHVAAANGRLGITADGKNHWRQLMIAPMTAVRHDLASLCEALKIAFLDGLEGAERDCASEDLLQARARCLSEQKRLLAACERACPQVARCRLHQLVMAEHALEGLREQLEKRA